MSLGLTLLPYYSPSADFSHTVLPRIADIDDLFEKIRGVGQLPVSRDFEAYIATITDHEGDDVTGYGPLRDDPYGDRLKYTTAEQLLTLQIGDDAYTQAAWAYLRCLPPDTKVAMY